MPQPKKGPRLGAGPSHQQLMLSNLASSLFEHERIKTTEARAKQLRPLAERLITKAKKGTVHHRRQVLSVIEDRDIVHKLFDDIAPRFVDRNGGYTRILKLGPRNGDGAQMALIELVEEGADGAAAASEEQEAPRRRRLRAPRRRGEARDLPQDKPARSRAAQAAAEGTPGPDADVTSHPDVAAETAAAETQAGDTELDTSQEQPPGGDLEAGPPQR